VERQQGCCKPLTYSKEVEENLREYLPRADPRYLERARDLKEKELKHRRGGLHEGT
jgi:hypothetical protein